jgi:uncharacterized Zn finger protein (UPF0148 family)
MAGLFGPSEEDLERLRSAVQSLGATSVPGLAAALSWRERKAERILAHEIGRPGSPVTYDPGRRMVRWARPLPDLATAPVPSVARAPPPPPAPRTPRAAAPVLTPTGLKSLCPSCRVPLQATGSGSLAVCPQCGRLSSVRTTAAGTSPPAAPAAAPRLDPPAPRSEGDAPAVLGDRRSQEMFAAWITAQPIPCPRCRTPLRHRGVSEYACPGCGHLVRFPASPSTPPATAARAPPAAARPP